MTPEHNLLNILVVLGGVLLMGLAIRSFNRSERRRVKPASSREAPSDLPGFWPDRIRRRYLDLDEEGRKRWWRRYNNTTSFVVAPLFLAVAFAALVLNNVVVALLGAALIVLAMLYSVEGR